MNKTWNFNSKIRWSKSKRSNSKIFSTKWAFLNLYDSSFLDIIYFTKGRIHPQLIHENYVYTFHIKEIDRTRWRCSKQSRSKCSATIYTSGHKAVMKNYHNHQPKQFHRSELNSWKAHKVFFIKPDSRKMDEVINNEEFCWFFVFHFTLSLIYFQISQRKVII